MGAGFRVRRLCNAGRSRTVAIYELPDAENQIPYALNVDKDGIVWICGTHNDTINRFDPETETPLRSVYRLVSRTPEKLNSMMRETFGRAPGLRGTWNVEWDR